MRMKKRIDEELFQKERRENLTKMNSLIEDDSNSPELIHSHSIPASCIGITIYASEGGEAEFNVSAAYYVCKICILGARPQFSFSIF